MVRKILALALVALVGGTAFAGPFFFRPRCNGPSCSSSTTTSPPATTPLPEFKEQDPLVPQPWLLTSEAEDTCSQQPDTVLVPLEGTGSKLLTGPKIPDKITHNLDADTMKKLEDLLKATSQNKAQVPISLAMEAATSERLSRISMLLEWLLWLGGGVFGMSSIGRVLPLVARLAAGLPSAIAAQSQAPAQTTSALPSQAPNK